MTQTSENLLEQIKEAITDLWWLSESDAPINVELWENAFPNGFSKPEFWTLSQQDSEQKLQKTTLEKFLRPAVTPKDWHGEEERQECEKFQHLQALLTDSFEEIRVLKLGEVCIDVFILGRTQENHWIVLTTQSVES